MVWNNSDFDVKQYHPKKRNRGYENSMTFPFPRGEDADLQNYIRSEGIEDRVGGGVMMTTAEILDFSEGSDSY
ncbi:MAG: hypothetical protein FWC96_01645 [Oscillospiraceae bacterium]|nr:hypothetical protein [Oscillospiraceae bacterium]